MSKLSPIPLLALGLAMVTAAQAPGPYALWHTYFAAGAQAVQAKRWQEAEALYLADVNQAESGQPKEPFLTIAKYCLATMYYEENRKEEMKTVLKTLNYKLAPEQIPPELANDAATFMTVGNIFYDEAAAVAENADKKKLTGDALQSASDDADWEYHFARRYFYWATLIKTRSFSSISPDLEAALASVGIASFKVREYADAAASFEQLLRIHKTSMQRQHRVSSGSVAYSLSGIAAGLNAPRLNGLGTSGGESGNISETTVALYVGVSYEGVGNQLAKEKPADAASAYTSAENDLRQYANHPVDGKYFRRVLARVDQEHAQVLRRINKASEASKLEAQAKMWQSRGT